MLPARTNFTSAHKTARASRNRSRAAPTPITMHRTWSPDSKKLLWSDRLQRLRYIDVATKAITLVDQDKFGEIQGYDWSPDSQWIVWARPEENDMPRVYLYPLANKQQTAVTDSWYGSGEAVFSDDGKYVLLQLSPRFQADVWGPRICKCVSRHAAGLSRHTRERNRQPTSPEELMKLARLKKNDKRRKRRKPKRKSRNKKPLRRSRKKSQKSQLL